MRMIFKNSRRGSMALTERAGGYASNSVGDGGNPIPAFKAGWKTAEKKGHR